MPRFILPHQTALAVVFALFSLKVTAFGDATHEVRSATEELYARDADLDSFDLWTREADAEAEAQGFDLAEFTKDIFEDVMDQANPKPKKNPQNQPPKQQNQRPKQPGQPPKKPVKPVGPNGPSSKPKPQVKPKPNSPVRGPKPQGPNSKPIRNIPNSTPGNKGPRFPKSPGASSPNKPKKTPARPSGPQKPKQGKRCVEDGGRALAARDADADAEAEAMFPFLGPMLGDIIGGIKGGITGKKGKRFVDVEGDDLLLAREATVDAALKEQIMQALASAPGAGAAPPAKRFVDVDEELSLLAAREAFAEAEAEAEAFPDPEAEAEAEFEDLFDF